MSNYIFLDIDGVLNNQEFFLSKEDWEWGVDDRCVKVLKRICKDFNAKVVLSSSWRRNLNPDLTVKKYLLKEVEENRAKLGLDYESNIEYLLRVLRENEIELVGITDTEVHLIDHVKWDRSGQIVRYIKAHFDDDDNFIIIDDDDLVGEGSIKYLYLQKYFIQTDFYGEGLNEAAYKKAKKIFNRKDKQWKQCFLASH